MSVATRVDELERLVPEWTELAEDTEEPNVFYEPFVLIPAMEQLAQGADVRVVFLRSPDGRLIGVVPLERHRWSLAVPAPHFTTWTHRYCFLSTPLVRRGCASEVVAALYAWLDTAGVAGRYLRLLGQFGGGAFDRAVEAVSPGRGRTARPAGGYERAFLTTGRPADRYFEETVPAKRRSEIRRKRKKLGEHGEVAVVVGSARDAVGALIPRFLDLEHRGWKGQGGTSMAANPRDRAFLEAVLQRSAGRHRLEYVGITVGEALVGATLNLRSADALFAFKIAYDEELGAYSPGVQVEVELLRRVLDDPDTSSLDSCSAPDYALGSFWSDRRLVRRMDLVEASGWGRGLVAVGAPLQEAADATRAWVRGLPPSVQRPLRQIVGVFGG